MTELRFTEDHEWIKVDGDIATIGISDYAQEQLGEVVYVELPEIGKELSKGDEACVVESVKAAGEVKLPAGGSVLEVNESLRDEPEKINTDPTGDGWFIKVKLVDPSEADGLMDGAAYAAYVEDL